MIGNKYKRILIDLNGVKASVDVYRVLAAFKVTNPQLSHLVKKALCAGVRGHKNELQDLIDIRDSAENAITAYKQGVRHV